MPGNKTIYLIDANSIISPYHNFYPFDMQPGFWLFLESKLISGEIIVLDKVFNEITVGDDDLSDWMKKIASLDVLSHKDASILSSYSQILNYIQSSPLL